MNKQNEIESFYNSLIRSDNISVTDRKRADNLVKMGVSNGVNVKYDIIGDKYQERYEVYIDKKQIPPRFDRLRYEKDSINYSVKLDPRNEALARALINHKDIDATDIETLLKDALFSYAYRELGKDKIDKISASINEEYTD